MKALHTTLVAIGLIATGLLIGGCSDKDYLGGETVGAEASSPLSQNAAHGGAPSATVYRASLTPLGESGVTGEAMIRVKGDRLLVSVNARGLEPSVVHAQHIHENGSCLTSEGSFAFRGVFVALDDDLSNSPGAGGGDGDNFPTATPGGTVNYRESDSKSAIESALGGSLNLANRTVVVHASNFAPVACGELNAVGN